MAIEQKTVDSRAQETIGNVLFQQQTGFERKHTASLRS